MVHGLACSLCERLRPLAANVIHDVLSTHEGPAGLEVGYEVHCVEGCKPPKQAAIFYRSGRLSGQLHGFFALAFNKWSTDG